MSNDTTWYYLTPLIFWISIWLFKKCRKTFQMWMFHNYTFKCSTNTLLDFSKLLKVYVSFVLKRSPLKFYIKLVSYFKSYSRKYEICGHHFGSLTKYGIPLLIWTKWLEICGYWLVNLRTVLVVQTKFESHQSTI